MKNKVTYDGQRYRVKLEVFDYTDSPILKWREKPTHFAVDRMDRRLPKSASFAAAGDQMYYGERIDEALACVQGWIQRKPEIPKWLKRYIKSNEISDTRVEGGRKKKLKVWNGRGRGRGEHLYVCATSRKHCVELVRSTGHVLMSLSELDVYWSAGCWGTPMAGVEPEIGVWVTRDRQGGPEGKPERLV